MEKLASPRKYYVRTNPIDRKIMQPRSSDTIRAVTPRGEPWSPSYEPDPDRYSDHEPNLAGTMAVGILFVVFGFLVVNISAVIGLGFVAFGFLVWLAAYAAGRYYDSIGAAADDTQWAEMEQDLISEQRAFDKKQLTEEQIAEIVKAVKSTIKVRCRYCGTLNDEAAGKCESCGANM